MMKKLNFLAGLIVLLTQGCLRHEYKEKITKEYYLYAYRDKEDMVIMHFDKYGGIEVVGPTVYAIGFDKDFIVAKQHPTIYPDKENKKVTNYFIIPLKDSISWSFRNVAIGPLSETEFKQKRMQLKVSDTLSFEVFIKEVE